MIAGVRWTEDTCVTLVGVVFSHKDALRPMVSINLTSSNSTMTTSVDETGKMKINLKFESDIRTVLRKYS